MTVGEVDRAVRALRDIVDTDPLGAAEAARRHLDLTADDDLLTIAHLRWVIGHAQRELGDLPAATSELTAAIEFADRAGDDRLAANIQSTLALSIARQGELDRALQLLRNAATRLDGADRGRVGHQIGAVLYWRGELEAAEAALVESAADLQRFGDQLGEVRSRTNLGGVLSRLGRHEEARRQLTRAVTVAVDGSFAVASGVALHNLGVVSARVGDVPGALQCFAQAEQRLDGVRASTNLPRLLADHAKALGDAALFEDAGPMLQRAVDAFAAQGQQTELAGGLLTAAEVRLANGDVRGAVQSAEQAAVAFDHQHRERWAALATAVALQGRVRLGESSPSIDAELFEAASRLELYGWFAEALRSRLVAAHAAAQRGATSDLVDVVTRAAVTRGPVIDRVLLAHVDALVAANRGDDGGTRRAISRGLRAAMYAQAALGSIEVRAHAAVHGNALTELGARLAIRTGRPRELLARIEATRLMSSRMPSLRPPADSVVAQLLATLRGITAQLVDPSLSEELRLEAERARSRIERDIRRRSRAARGDASARIGLRHEIDSALAVLGDRQLLAHARLDGRLHAVSVVGRRARLHDLGTVDDVNERIEGLTFSLHRLNRTQGSEESRLAAAEMLYAFADELAEIVLPPIIADSLDPVVIVPTAILHDVPWGLLPPLAGRPVSVNPSVSAWGHAERTLRQRRGTLLDGIEAGFVAGPGLDFADVEVKHLAGGYVDPAVLTGSDATVGACTDLLSRAELVHIACHGSFRRDNPMFSSLHVADGPLNVYDLEGLERLPVVVVLSSCSVANAKVVQGGSLLGLANAFTTLGAASVIAPLTPISDAASVTVMDRLHRALVAGADPAAALAAATMSHDVTDPTAAAFIALGA